MMAWNQFTKYTELGTEHLSNPGISGVLLDVPKRLGKRIMKLDKTHNHGNVKYPVPLNDSRCPVCNQDGHLSSRYAKCELCDHTRASHIIGMGRKCLMCDCPGFVPKQSSFRLPVEE